MRTLRFLLRKEYRQIVRDRMMLAQILIMPVIQLLLLANAATFEVTRARLYAVDLDRTVASRNLVDRLVSSGRFALVGASASMAAADSAMLGRRADVIARIPRRFERDLTRSDAAPVQLVFDAKDGAAAAVTRSYASQIVTAYASELGAAQPAGAARTSGAPDAAAPRVEVRSRAWYNPELQYRDYMVPGILVELITIAGTLLTAVNITREKEIGTLDQLNVTPVTRAQFIAGKLIPLWSIALVEFGVGLIVAAAVFHVPMRGSVLLVLAVAAVYLVAALGVGLWVSTIAGTQQQAMFITFFLMLVYLLMSGLFTPLRSMPFWAQWIAHLNPVMYFVAIMRDVLMKGAGPADIAPSVGVLVLYGAVVFTLAVRQYAKRTA